MAAQTKVSFKGDLFVQPDASTGQAVLHSFTTQEMVKLDGAFDQIQLQASGDDLTILDTSGGSRGSCNKYLKRRIYQDSCGGSCKKYVKFEDPQILEKFKPTF